MTKGSHFIRENMSDSDYRPEQIFVRDFLPKCFKLPIILDLEYRISGLTIDGKPYRSAVLDIAVFLSIVGQLAIRLNGGYHFVSTKQRTKDDFQKTALEQAGWEVVDFNDYDMPNLFKKKRSTETDKLAEEEIRRQLGKTTTKM